MKMKNVMMKSWCERRLQELCYTPHVLMIMSSFAIALYLLLLKLFNGDSPSAATPLFASAPAIIVFYQHLISSFLLFPLCFFSHREKRPHFSFQLFCWAFLLGFLQITLSELLLTASQRYVPATIQTAIINACPAIVFVLALVFKRENFKFWSIRDQAKLWGLVLSVFGATIMVLCPGAELRDPTRLGETQALSNRALGGLLVSCGVMALASSIILVEHVATKFDSNMSLAAMTSLSGAVQSGIIAAITKRDVSAWLGLFQCGLGIGTILYGGIVVAGLMFYAQIWCIHKRGPVFVAAFSPLLIVFSFLLETPFFGTYAHAGSIFGLIIVVLGLYLLLWGKAIVEEEEESIYGESKTSEENYPIIVHNYCESLGLNYPLISNMSGFPIIVT